MADQSPKDQYSLSVDITPYGKKRRVPDRRARRTSFWSPYTFRGRRKAIRRDEETAGGYYLDRYGFRDWAPSVAVVVLCSLDLLANLILQLRGGTDPSPLTAWASSISPILAVAVQLLPTLALGFVLLLASRQDWSRRLATALLVLFAILAVWHGAAALRADASSNPPAIVRAD